MQSTDSQTTFTTTVRFPDAGITIGDSNDLHLYIENGNQGVIANEVGVNNIIRFKTSNANSQQINSAIVHPTGINWCNKHIYIRFSTAKWRMCGLII